MENHREYLYKVLVVGDIGTGKTSIIKRYVHSIFSTHYKSTIGVDFALKVLNLDANTTVRLQLWDIAGQERFGNMTRVYYKDAVGAFVVYDVTRTSSFDAVLKWKADLDNKVSIPGTQDPISVVLVGNKVDLLKEGESGVGKATTDMEAFCKEHGFVGYFETSAKDNIGIEEAAMGLITNVMEKVVLEQEDDNENIVIGQETLQQEDDCAC